MNVWITARGAGLSALTLLTISTCIGALVSRRAATGQVSDLRSIGRRYVAQHVHRTVAALGLAALTLHVTAILADSYAHVGWRGALIPFTSAYRPVWVGVGTLAVYTFLLVAGVGMARGRMASSPRAARSWRALHCLAYAGWAAAMLHGLNSGTDSSTGWVRLLYVVCLSAVLGAAGIRLLTLAPRGADRFADPAADRFGARPPVAAAQPEPTVPLLSRAHR
ncbi:ferric reductase [uncultured Jatrophihabitans sp.]|uniref:ferric reductase n=1 Tax=uncultured Jatrophihabitans sp. TaxID=1610747 RepID=UPI0035CA168A